MMPLFWVSLSLSAVAGMFLFGYGVTSTVSERILTLAGAAALAAQLGGALTVHLFTQFGVPVSITQAVIGGIMGIGQAKDIVIMDTRTVLRVILGWVMAPLVGLGLACLLLALP
jgi:PiT family inorganic phosphate transporter